MDSFYFVGGLCSLEAFLEGDQVLVHAQEAEIHEIFIDHSPEGGFT